MTRECKLTKAQQALDWVRHSSKATHAAWQVLIILAFYVNDETGLSYPSIDTIAYETRLKRRTVFIAIDALLESGELEIVARRRHNSTAYRIGFSSADFDTREPESSADFDTREGVSSADFDASSANNCVTSAEKMPKPQVSDSHLYKTSRATSTTTRERYDECVRLIAHHRSQESWVKSPVATKKATIKKLSDPDEVDAEALQVWLDQNPDMSVDDIAGCYLRHEIPGTDDYQMPSDRQPAVQSDNPAQLAQQRIQHMTPLDRAREALRIAEMSGDALGIEAARDEVAALAGRQLEAVAS